MIKLHLSIAVCCCFYPNITVAVFFVERKKEGIWPSLSFITSEQEGKSGEIFALPLLDSDDEAAAEEDLELALAADCHLWLQGKKLIVLLSTECRRTKKEEGKKELLRRQTHFSVDRIDSHFLLHLSQTFSPHMSQRTGEKRIEKKEKGTPNRDKIPYFLIRTVFYGCAAKLGMCSV